MCNFIARRPYKVERKSRVKVSVNNQSPKENDQSKLGRVEKQEVNRSPKSINLDQDAKCSLLADDLVI